MAPHPNRSRGAFSSSSMGPHANPSRGALSSIFHREVGLSRPCAFTRGVGEGLVTALEVAQKLEGHVGPVNSVQFNHTGNLLVCSLDDGEVIIWNWADNSKKVSYCSGHLDRVFQAQIMPFTNDRSVITCGADSQVRHGQIADDGEVTTKEVGNQRSDILKLAIEPNSPHIFYGCGQDGIVERFDLRTPSPDILVCSTTFDGTQLPVRLNNMAIDPRNPYFLAVGGSDQFARLYDTRNCPGSASDRPVTAFSPLHLIDSKKIRITGLAYSNTSELLVSYSDELIYLFQKGMGIGPNPLSAPADHLQNRSQPQVYSGHRNGMSNKGACFFGPSDEFVLSGSDCEHLYIWKKQGAKLKAMIPCQIVNLVEPHPYAPFLATSGNDRTVKLWCPTGNNLAPFPPNPRTVWAANRRGRVLRAALNSSPKLTMLLLRSHPNELTAQGRRLIGNLWQGEEEDEGEEVEDVVAGTEWLRFLRAHCGSPSNTSVA